MYTLVQQLVLGTGGGGGFTGIALDCSATTSAKYIHNKKYI